MALRIITGTLGAGKTYYAVSMIVKDFCNYIPETKEYRLKDDVVLISNIDSLKLPHQKLSDLVPDKDFNKFFSYENQKTFCLNQHDKSIVYMIDEAQRIFHRKYENRDVFSFFELHRHLGVDIYLITQNLKRFCTSIVDLAEATIKAQSRSVSFIGELKYIHIVEGEIVDRSFLKKNDKIFKLYKSQDKKEYKKVNNPFFLYIFILVIIFLAMGYWFYGHLFSKPGKILNQVKTETSKIDNAISDKVSKRVTLAPGVVSSAADLPGSTESIDYRVRLSYIKRGDVLTFIHPYKGYYFVKKQSPYVLEFYDNVYYAVMNSQEYNLYKQYINQSSFDVVSETVSKDR